MCLICKILKLTLKINEILPSLKYKIHENVD